jgi:general secretion pathway protein K
MKMKMKMYRLGKQISTRHCRYRHRGIALVSVLWVLVLLSSVAAATVMEARTNATVSRNLIDASSSRNLAEGAIHLAVHNLYRDDAGRWMGDGSVRKLSVGDATVDISVMNESGKVDLNFGSAQILQRLLAAAGADNRRSAEIAAAILDWRDPDNLHRLNGAEAQAYRSMRLGYEPANANFESIDELRLVLGMDSELFAKLRPSITVHSGQAGINLAAASPLVLWAISDLSQDEDAAAMPQDEPADFDRAAIARGVNREFVARSVGDVYSIVAQAESYSGAITRINAIVHLEQQAPGHPPFRILAWSPEAAAQRQEAPL